MPVRVNMAPRHLVVAATLPLLTAAFQGAALRPSFGTRTRSRMAPSMAVAAKDSYKITLLPGDGIGPEITTATVTDHAYSQHSRN